MADNRVFPKQQIEIVQVQEEKPYAGGSKSLLPVMAKNLSLLEGDPLVDKSLKYTVFNQDLRDHIKGLAAGARFLCDIEERDRPDSEYGPDRNIVQIYVNNQPISKKKTSGGYGKTPEIVRLEHELELELEGVKRRSTEGQTAIAQVGSALTCPTPIPGEDLAIDEETWARIVGKYWQAVERSLDNFLAQPPTNLHPVVWEAAPEGKQGAQDVNPGDAKDKQVSKDNPPTSAPIKHVGDLLTRASRLKPPVTRDELCTAMSVNDQAEIANLEEAWKTAQEISKSKPV